MMKTLRFTVIASLWCIAAPSAQQRPAASVEDIYIARSVRTSRVAPTEFCAASRTGFGDVLYEDHYDFHGTAARATDGKVTEALGKTIGQVRACFGSTTDPLKVNFYAEGDLAALSFTGKGSCEGTKPDFPEAGVTAFRCMLDLSDLPRGYVGGLLTSNSMRSRENIGATSDPPGYVQPSIATIRLWKQRP